MYDDRHSDPGQMVRLGEPLLGAKCHMGCILQRAIEVSGLVALLQQGACKRVLHPHAPAPLVVLDPPSWVP